MKRVTILMTVCAALMLPAGPAAAAPRQLPAHGHDLDRSHAGASSLAVEQSSGKVRFVPLGARLSAISISGNVLASTGSPCANATVESWVPDGSTWLTDSTTTDSSGNWSLQTVPALNNGEVYAYPAAGGILARLAMSWSDGTRFSISAGRLSVTGERGGPWGDFDELTVRLWGDDAFSKGYVDATDTSTTPVTGEFDAQGGTYSVGSVNFFDDEGMEFSGSFNVTAFTSSGGTTTAYEADAQRTTVTSPYWASGKPGSTIKVMRGNFPAGWINAVSGYSEYPEDATVKPFGLTTSSSAADQPLSVKVPSTATPGYWYYVGMQHTNGLGKLYLETPFQVCTMKPSKTSMRKGTKVRVTGVVPIYRHWGNQAGTPKTVTLYAHKGTAGVPTKWNPTGQGWVKVGAVKTNKYGAYTTPYFKPLKTLTLVVRYPADKWWWGAYTSPQKITVR